MSWLREGQLRDNDIVADLSHGVGAGRRPCVPPVEPGRKDKQDFSTDFSWTDKGRDCDESRGQGWHLYAALVADV